MRSIFTNLYDSLTAPLYRKLYRDFSLQVQDLNTVHIQHYERTTRKIVDELLRFNLLIEQHLPETIEPSSEIVRSLSNREIAEIVKDIDDSVGAVEICHKHQLPMKVVLELKGKFSGLNTGGIRRARELEQQCEILARKVELLAQENEQLAATATQGSAGAASASGKQ
jgi:hypothetical protein